MRNGRPSRVAAVLLVLLVFGCWRGAAAQGAPRDLAPLFAGREGSFVVCDAQGEVCSRYNPALAAERFSPFATFDIVHTLIGLETGAIPDPEFALDWDPDKYPEDASIAESWADRQDLRSAFRDAVTWYWRETAERIGSERMAAILREIGYGNADLSDGIDRFWFDGSLRIAPDEQVALIGRLLRDDLPFGPSGLAALRDIAAVEAGKDFTLFGRTGSGPAEDGWHGWFVGWLETATGRYAFATFLKTEDHTEAAERLLPITQAALRRTGVLPGG